MHRQLSLDTASKGIMGLYMHHAALFKNTLLCNTPEKCCMFQCMCMHVHQTAGPVSRHSVCMDAATRVNPVGRNMPTAAVQHNVDSSSMSGASSTAASYDKQTLTAYCGRRWMVVTIIGGWQNVVERHSRKAARMCAQNLLSCNKKRQGTRAG
jgi:hypothetical protein